MFGGELNLRGRTRSSRPVIPRRRRDPSFDVRHDLSSRGVATRRSTSAASPRPVVRRPGRRRDRFRRDRVDCSSAAHASSCAANTSAGEFSRPGNLGGAARVENCTARPAATRSTIIVCSRRIGLPTAPTSSFKTCTQRWRLAEQAPLEGLRTRTEFLLVARRRRLTCAPSRARRRQAASASADTVAESTSSAQEH